VWIASHPDLVHDVLVAGRDVFRRIERPGNEPFGLGVALGEGLLTTDGPGWQRQRRMMAPMFHRQRIEAMATTMVAAGRAMCDRLDAAAGPVDLAEEMKLVTLDIINRTMFSADVLPEVAEIGDAVDVALHFIATRERQLRPTPLTWPTRRNRRFRRAMAALDGYLYGLIAARRASRTRHEDLLGMLLAAHDAETDASMSDRQIRDEIATVYGAGHETTGAALTWAWYLLATHPQQLADLHAEVDGVLAGRDPAVGDLARLPYTRMVFEESMRLLPPVPLTGRMAAADTDLAGATIGAGGIVVLAIANIHRHPLYWEQPNRFRPERFAPRAHPDRHRYAYLPFGAGPHLCIGNHFAMIEGQLLLAMLAARYDVELLAPAQVRREVAITMRPREGLPVRLRRR
jgi:cytochrome P450